MTADMAVVATSHGPRPAFDVTAPDVRGRTNSMRLLVVEERPDFGGGSERMSLTLAAHAVKRGHRVWLVHETAGSMVRAYRDAGAETEQAPVHPIAVREPWRAWRSFRALRAVARRHRIDVILTSQVNYVSLLAAVGAATRTRTAVHLGLVYDYPSPIFRAGTRHIDAGIVPSAHTAAGWIARGWPERSLRIIANGVDTTLFAPRDGREAARRRLFGSSHPDPIIAFVGRVVEPKGVFTLMRAFAAVRQDRPDARLVLAGGASAADAARLCALAREGGVPDDRWALREPTSAPEDLYRAADVVVVPSEWDEPFGLVPVEALACGTFVLVSDRGVLPSFVAACGPEAVFRSGDVAGLSDRLAYWLSDTDRRERAARRASEDVRERFAFERCGDAYLDLFASWVAA